MSTPRAWSSSPEMLAGVILESRRVVAAHSRHFLALSVLFLLPLASIPYLLASFPFPNLPSIAPPQSLLRSSSPSPLSAAALTLSLAAAALTLAASAATAVAHSVNHGFFGRPVHLLPALKSLPAALWRLLLTLLAALLPVTLLASLLLLIIPPSALPIAFSVLAAAAAIYVALDWPLAAVIAVLESAWGFEPLRRSARLIRGMRSATLCLNLFFATGIGVMLWGFSLGKVRVAGGWSVVIPVVARTVFCTAVTTVLLLYCLVTNVVMYLYCKALHGELATEIAEEFAWEYVCLPFDDQKVPHVVSVVRQ